MTSPTTPNNSWHLFKGDGKQHSISKFPAAPPWRRFPGAKDVTPLDRKLQAATKRVDFQFDEPEIALVNAAIYLRRPLLVTGKPGIGKSTLVHSIAYELDLGPVLTWPINTRSTLEEGLWRYDAIGRLQEEKGKGASAETLGRYVRLGPLGTAFLPSKKPRVLLIDEIDKSDIDLPNDLLNIFEDGWFDIPVLSRATWKEINVRAYDGEDEITIEKGHVQAIEFPIVVMTSNGERDFPQPFQRRCIRLDMKMPDENKLKRIIAAHLKFTVQDKTLEHALVKEFVDRAQRGDLATDQLMNAIYLTTEHSIELGALKDVLLQKLE
ncbi:MAG TPA: MoxR family ATPase [Thermoanaerobaculia bacterium]|nr:MoxR family ATPase [Thermoanaerobaculia bacterium]